MAFAAASALASPVKQSWNCVISVCSPLIDSNIAPPVQWLSANLNPSVNPYLAIVTIPLLMHDPAHASIQINLILQSTLTQTSSFNQFSPRHLSLPLKQKYYLKAQSHLLIEVFWRATALSLTANPAFQACCLVSQVSYLQTFPKSSIVSIRSGRAVQT